MNGNKNSSYAEQSSSTAATKALPFLEDPNLTPPIRHAAIDFPSDGNNRRPLARAFLLQLFHLRSFRSLVLSLKIPDKEFSETNRRKCEPIHELQKLFRSLETVSDLPTIEECNNLNDERLRIAIPIIRSMILSDGPSSAYKPSDRIYGVNPVGGIYSLMQVMVASDRTKNERLLQKFNDLIMIPSCRGFECVNCGDVNKKVHGNIYIRLPKLEQAREQTLERYMESLFRSKNATRSSSACVCSSCSTTQPNQREAVLFRAHLFPRNLIIRSKSTSQDSPVRFGNVLDLTPYCIEGKECKLVYRLSGVIAQSIPIAEKDPPPGEQPTTTTAPLKYISYIRERTNPSWSEDTHAGQEQPEQKSANSAAASAPASAPPAGSGGGATWLKFPSSTNQVTRVSESDVLIDCRGGISTGNSSDRFVMSLLFYERLRLPETEEGKSGRIPLLSGRLQIWTQTELGQIYKGSGLGAQTAGQDSAR